MPTSARATTAPRSSSSIPSSSPKPMPGRSARSHYDAWSVTPRGSPRSPPRWQFPGSRMGPRFGRLYATAVLRPLAEQVVAALGVQSDDTACDLMCDSATLGIAFGAAVGARGRVLLIDTDASVLVAAAGEVSATGC